MYEWLGGWLVGVSAPNNAWIDSDCIHTLLALVVEKKPIRAPVSPPAAVFAPMGNVLERAVGCEEMRRTKRERERERERAKRERERPLDAVLSTAGLNESWPLSDKARYLSICS